MSTSYLHRPKLIGWSAGRMVLRNGLAEAHNFDRKNAKGRHFSTIETISYGSKKAHSLIPQHAWG